jgi:hypothetical protein
MFIFLERNMYRSSGPVNVHAEMTPFWIIMPALLLLFNIITGFDGTYGQDSFEYLRYSRALHDYFTGGPFPGPFRWPLLYPLSGALFSFILPDVFSLQLVSIISYGVTILFLRKICTQLFPGKSRLTNTWLVLFFALSPFILRYSSTVMSESMTMAFLTGFLYFYLRFSSTGLRKYFLLLVLFASCAVNTRYPSFVILLVPLIHAVYLFIRRFSIGWFLPALAIPVLVFLPDYFLSLHETASLASHSHVDHWSFLNYFRRTFVTVDGTLSYTFPNLFYVTWNFFYPGFIFAGIVILLFFRPGMIHSSFYAATAGMILLYALFLAGLTFQNDRVLLLSFPCVIVILAPAFAGVSEWIMNKGKMITTIMVSFVILVQLGLFYRAFRPFYRDEKIVRDISEKILQYPGKPIYTFNIDLGLKMHGVKNEMVSLWGSRIDHFEPGSLVLFNYGTTYIQWKGMNPMLNWSEMNSRHHLEIRENLPGGWTLYEIGD